MLQLSTCSLVLPPLKRSLQNEGSVTQLQLLPKWKQIQYVHSLKINPLRERKTIITRASWVESILSGELKDENLVTVQNNKIWRKLWAFYSFTRPYSIMGIILAVPSFGIIALDSAAELSMPVFVGFLQAFTTITLMHIYANTINQVYDVDVDKVNKPYLPLASGELSMEFGIAFTAALPILSLGMAIMFQSPVLIKNVITKLILGTAYSVHAPLLHWKGKAFLALTAIMIARIGDHVAAFLHIQKYVLGKPTVYPKSFIFGIAFVFAMFCIVSFYKDIPDADGDKDHGIQSLAVIIGKEKAFWLCVSIVLMGYGAAMVVGASCTTLTNKIITVLGHGALAIAFWLKARSIDLGRNESIHTLYMFIWKLSFAEYILIPFIR